MNCEIIQKNDLHEKYVLERMSDSEKLAYEQHLQSCAACRKQLQAQRWLISGIRETGRAEMKEEMRRQVASLDGAGKRVNWGMLARLAAVLFIVVLSPTVYYIYKTSVPGSAQVFEEVQVLSSVSLQAQADSVGDSKEMRRAVAQNETGREEARQRAGQARVPAKQQKSSESVADAGGELEKSVELVMRPNERSDAIKVSEKDDVVSAQGETFVMQAVQPTSFFRDDSDKGEREMFESGATADLLLKKSKTETVPLATFDVDKIAVQESTTAASGRLWSFQFDSLTIVVEPVVVPADSSAAEAFPQSFGVEISERDSRVWRMKWFVNREFAALDASEISIKRLGADLLEVAFENKVAYRITLQNKTGVATRTD